MKKYYVRCPNCDVEDSPLTKAKAKEFKKYHLNLIDELPYLSNRCEPVMIKLECEKCDGACMNDQDICWNCGNVLDDEDYLKNG